MLHCIILYCIVSCRIILYIIYYYLLPTDSPYTPNQDFICTDDHFLPKIRFYNNDLLLRLILLF